MSAPSSISRRRTFWPSALVWVVKAQIHAGGRGKGGGVKLARSIEDVKKLSSEILGMQLITHQTSAEGQKSVAC